MFVLAQSMAVKIVETILKVSTEISEPAQVETLLDFVKPLIADIPGVEVDEEVCPQLIGLKFSAWAVTGSIALCPHAFHLHNEDGEEMGQRAGLPGRAGSCGKTHPHAEVSRPRPAVCCAAHGVGAPLCGRPAKAEAYHPAHSLCRAAHRKDEGCNRVWPAFCTGGESMQKLPAPTHWGCMVHCVLKGPVYP